MAKRLNPRKLRAVLTYTVPELAIALGVTAPTVRAMIKDGLPTLACARPTLIVGEAAQDFISERNAATKRPLGPEELFCFTCKEPRRPYGMMVDLVRSNAGPFRIFGMCEDCGGKCSRTISRKNLDQIDRTFDTGRNTAQRP